MKKSLKSLVSLFCVLLLLLLCACQPAPELPDEPESSKEESRTLPEIAKAYRADVETVAAEYEGKLSPDVIQSLTASFTQSVTKTQYAEYDEDPEKFLDKHIRYYFDFWLNYRSCGSADAPIAPDAFETACEMIREEYKDLIDNEDRAEFEEILATMEHSIAGAQNPTPYSDSPQAHFDSMRFSIWNQFFDRNVPYPGNVW